MAWRLAKSLQVLENQVLGRWSGTTVWDIGDEAHQRTASDHNPNPAGVVCAIDVLGDGGMDLGWYAARVAGSRHPALKYVIYNRRIWSTARASEGWRPYGGSNPHTGHVHVSVGVGPDGQSTGPYDDTSPWGLLEEDMPLTKQDVEAIWNTDGVIAAPATRSDQANEFWTGASYLATLANRSHRFEARLAAIDAKVDLVLQIQAATAAAVREVLGSLDEPVLNIKGEVIT